MHVRTLTPPPPLPTFVAPADPPRISLLMRSYMHGAGDYMTTMDAEVFSDAACSDGRGCGGDDSGLIYKNDKYLEGYENKNYDSMCIDGEHGEDDYYGYVLRAKLAQANEALRRKPPP